jgi:hypothetical protein
MTATTPSVELVTAAILRRGCDRFGGDPVRRGLEGTGGSATYHESGMKQARSIPPHPALVLVCPDGRDAVDWLRQAFRLPERIRIGEDHRSPRAREAR